MRLSCCTCLTFARLLLQIAKKARGPDVMLSRQTLLNCATYEGLGNGCDGGDPIHVFKYMDE